MKATWARCLSHEVSEYFIKTNLILSLGRFFLEALFKKVWEVERHVFGIDFLFRPPEESCLLTESNLQSIQGGAPLNIVVWWCPHSSMWDDFKQNSSLSLNQINSVQFQLQIVTLFGDIYIFTCWKKVFKRSVWQRKIFLAISSFKPNQIVVTAVFKLISSTYLRSFWRLQSLVGCHSRFLVISSWACHSTSLSFIFHSFN